VHPPLPHFERLGDAVLKMGVLARERIDLTAPSVPFIHGGRTTFDGLLHSGVGGFTGDVLVGDATLWSDTAEGLDSRRRLWANVVQRPLRRQEESVMDGVMCRWASSETYDKAASVLLTPSSPESETAGNERD
jgi:hypothetical protein